MKIRCAPSSEPGAVSIREHLQRAAAAKGIRGEGLVIEVIQWGLLKDDFVAAGKPENPTVAEYAERFARTL